MQVREQESQHVYPFHAARESSFTQPSRARSFKVIGMEKRELSFSFSSIFFLPFFSLFSLLSFHQPLPPFPHPINRHSIMTESATPLLDSKRSNEQWHVLFLVKICLFLATINKMGICWLKTNPLWSKSVYCVCIKIGISSHTQDLASP